MRRAAVALAITASMAAPAQADERGGDIPEHFVGVSVEWTLTDRYMGDGARPAFANLLRNLGSGMLSIGGSSQDQVPFDATAADTDRLVTPHDLLRVRQTLDVLQPGWVSVLGTAMAPPTEEFPWRSVDHAVAFARDGVAPLFGDPAGRRMLAGIALGNEPDLTYEGDLARYLTDFSAYAEAVNGWPRVVPATSEPIAAWQSIRDRTIDTRWFWEWPAILDHLAPAVRGTFATDHFYALARGCSTDPYRCATIERLLRSSACCRRSAWTTSAMWPTRTRSRRRGVACATGWTRPTARAGAAPRA
jgi:hypothetical protein